MSEVAYGSVEYWRKEAEFWREQQALAANVAATIADMDEVAPALRQLLRQEKDRRRSEERRADAAELALDAAEQRGYLRGRSEQRAADVAALRDGQIIAYDRWLAETGRIDDGSACILDGRDLWSVSEYLESLPVAGGEGPETP